MAQPTLTADEIAAIDGAILVISQAQADRDQKMQARVGHDSDLTAIGLDPGLVSEAHSLGFHPEIQQYDGPLGAGWVLVLTLDRDGKWQMCHNEGPETWRHRDWFLVEGPPQVTA